MRWIVGIVFLGFVALAMYGAPGAPSDCEKKGGVVVGHGFGTACVKRLD